MGHTLSDLVIEQKLSPKSLDEYKNTFMYLQNYVVSYNNVDGTYTSINGDKGTTEEDIARTL